MLSGSVISSFCREVNKSWALRGYYASYSSQVLKRRPICCPETSVRNYYHGLRNIPENRIIVLPWWLNKKKDEVCGICCVRVREMQAGFWLKILMEGYFFGTNFNAHFNMNMYAILSSTCFGPWHAHLQEEQLYKHSIWYPRSELLSIFVLTAENATCVVCMFSYLLGSCTLQLPSR